VYISGTASTVMLHFVWVSSSGLFGMQVPPPQSVVGLLSAQAWMPAYASILHSPRQSLDPIKNSCFPYQV
jgi:hypothetical protein